MANVAMTYGDYDFSPIPLITIRRVYTQAGNRDLPVGFRFEATLTGVLTPLPAETGLLILDDLMEELREAFNQDGKLFTILCDTDTVMKCYPRITNIEFNESNNNWVETVPFTITMNYDEDEFTDEQSATDIPPYIEEYNEEWQMEFVEEHRAYLWDLSTVTDQSSGDYGVDSNNTFEARVTHTISAKGKQSWGDGGAFAALQGTSVSAADNAMNWLNNVFGSAGYGYDATNWGHSLSGWNNLPANTGEYGIFDHFRSHQINEVDGTASLTETWFVAGTNSGLDSPNRKCSEDFTVSMRNSIENGKTTMTIEGQIRGLVERDYGNIVDTLEPPDLRVTSVTAYENAQLAWSQIQNRVFPRAQFVYEQTQVVPRLNPNPLNVVVGHNPSKGVITYNYEFDSRPCAFITGALSENFTIVDNHPTDVFAKLTVLGRSAGPLFQDIGTSTEATREVTIEAVMPLPTGCSSLSDLDLYNPGVNVANLLCEFEQGISGDQVFKHVDTESWNPLTGRYSRTVGWTYGGCSGPIDTSVC